MLFKVLVVRFALGENVRGEGYKIQNDLRKRGDAQTKTKHLRLEKRAKYQTANINALRANKLIDNLTFFGTGPDRV